MAQTASLPPVSSLSTLPTSERGAVLDLLFEASTQLHTLAVGILQKETFSSYDDLIASVGVLLTDLAESTSTSDKEWLENILGAHPRLGEKNILSVQSRLEQARLDAGAGSEEEELARLNQEYEKAFPGLRYVVFVNGRSRPVIMNDIKERIARGDIILERFEGIKAMCEIAADRANKARAAA
ncbi:hypothetical protein MMC13_003544 [Lambiella insularis]|nr:hypothetical protein [Lambiella insularis]